MATIISHGIAAAAIGTAFSAAAICGVICAMAPWQKGGVASCPQGARFGIAGDAVEE